MRPSIQNRRTASILHRALCRALSELIQPVYAHALLSVTHVSVAPDLSCAKAYVSVLPETQSDLLIQHMILHTPYVKKRLAALVGKKLRKIPHVLFVKDKALQQAIDLQTLFSRMSLPAGSSGVSDLCDAVKD